MFDIYGDYRETNNFIPIKCPCEIEIEEQKEVNEAQQAEIDTNTETNEEQSSAITDIQSSVSNITLEKIDQLTYVFTNASGETTDINLIGSGETVTYNVDADSESFLYLNDSKDGFGVSGINAAISNAMAVAVNSAVTVATTESSAITINDNDTTLEINSTAITVVNESGDTNIYNFPENGGTLATKDDIKVYHSDESTWIKIDEETNEVSNIIGTFENPTSGIATVEDVANNFVTLEDFEEAASVCAKGMKQNNQKIIDLDAKYDALIKALEARIKALENK